MSRYTSPVRFVAMGLLALLFAPIVVLAGDPALERYRRRRYSAAVLRSAWMAGQVGSAPGAGESRLNLALLQFGMHPVVIAMTAPGRWVRPKLRALRRGVRWLLRSPAARRRGWGGGHEGLFPDDPGLSGVREPRRPHPMPPADAVALHEPSQHTGRD